MNLKNQKPIFVPFEFRREMEKLSNAALAVIAARRGLGEAA
jgi:hypothetical protein